MTDTTETEIETEMSETTAADPSVRHVPLHSLWLEHDRWVNPRTIILDDEVSKLAESVADRGILIPLAVVQVRTPTGDVINLVLDGQQRCLAARKVLSQDALIPVLDARPGIIEELTWEISDQLLAIALDIGIRRTELSSYELCETAERLRNRQMPGTEISRMIGKSESWVSRMCKARLSATSALLLRWKHGEITDEQFKDLASEKDAAVQNANAKAVVEARKGGDRAEARLLAKESGAKAKASAKAEPRPSREPSKDKAPPASDKAKAKRTEQADLPNVAPDAPEPPKAVPLPKATLEDIVAMAAQRPPVHDYVRGVMDMAAAALGKLDMSAMAKPWAQYISRLGGTGKAAKPAKASKKGKKGKK